MPGFATLRKVQKPMSLQQTEERIKIIKLLSKILKINFKKEKKKLKRFTHTWNEGRWFKKFQITITIVGHLKKVMESQATKRCCKTKNLQNLQNPKPWTLWSNHTPQKVYACRMFFQWEDKRSNSSQNIKLNGKTINLVQASILTRGKTAGLVASIPGL